MATYAETANLVNSSTFRDAVTVAVAKYAAYILNEGAGVAYHNQRVQWAKPAYQNPGGVAGGLLAAIALDSNIQSNMPTPSDAQIQAATEVAVNTTMAF